MNNMLTLIPAYGRDYDNEDQVRKDFQDNKDFQICDISDGIHHPSEISLTVPQ